MKRKQLLNSIDTGTSSIGGDKAMNVNKETLDSANGTELEYEDVFEKKEWGYVRKDWEQPDGPDRPVVFAMDGYDSASAPEGAPTHYLRLSDGPLLAMSIGLSDPTEGLDDEYITVDANIRATGCSGGSVEQYDPYDPIGHGRDGYEAIEWLADRSWSLDRVGLWGVSYAGMTALNIAATQPPSLACVMANLVMGDILRGRTFPGGVDNRAYDIWLSNLPVWWWPDDRVVPDDDPICQAHYDDRDVFDAIDHLDWHRHRTESSTYNDRSFINKARQIEVPTYISHAWQDGQTGPRGGPAVYKALDPNSIHPDDIPGRRPLSPEIRDSPKLFRASNGIHGNVWQEVGSRDAQRWYDYWLLGEDTGIMEEDPVQLEFGMDTEESYSTTGLDEFPASDTTWERYYICEDHTLSTKSPESEGADTYTNAPPDFWYMDDLTGDNVLTYWSEPFETPKIIAGTITATLFMESSKENTEIFVSLADMEPNGEQITYLQRGMLRTSYRDLDKDRTRYNDEGEITRPVYSMSDPTPIIPGKIYRYDIEVFPLGHLIYPGHQLLINIHSTPLLEGEEPGGPRYWLYNPLDDRAKNTLYHDENHQSSVLFPMLDWPERNDLPPEPDCGEPDGYVCIDVDLPSE